jgi:hypothetical protein
MSTFYLCNVMEAERATRRGLARLKGIPNISRIQVSPAHSTITRTGALDQMPLAQKLVSDI